MQYTKAMLDKYKVARKNITDTTNHSQFRKQHTELEGKGLNPTQILMLTYIYDTMELSWENGDQYYDKKRHNYYAIVSRKTMTEKYGIKDSAVGDNLQFLEDVGYIKKVHCMNLGTKVFVRHFSYEPEKPKSNVSKSRNSITNHTYLNHIHSNTRDTSSVSPQESKSSEQQQSNQDTESTKRDNRFEKQNKLISLKSSLLNSHIPEKVIRTAMQFFNEPKHIHKLFGNLFQAKKSAKLYATKNPQKIFKSMEVEGFVGDKEQINKSFNFEDNKNMLTGLPNAIRHAVYKAKTTANNFGAYFKAVLKKYFLDSAREQVDNYALELKANENNPVRIPIIKL